MTSVEICVHSESEVAVQSSVSAAYEGGAERIELCADMANDGLTPPLLHIEVARSAFKERSGVLVMIRPVAGDFFYTTKVVNLMEQQIIDAARAGADGVVFGVLNKTTQAVHREHCQRLIKRAKALGLQTTFHRAVDATADWQQALDTIIELGFDRVLSCGLPWGEPGSALDGIAQLQGMLVRAQSRIELVAGGGVNQHNAKAIVDGLKGRGRFSLHAYSSVLTDGVANKQKVSKLITVAK